MIGRMAGVATAMACVAAQGATIYTQNFDGVLGAEWSGVTTTESVQGLGSLGFSGNLLRNTSGGTPTASGTVAPQATRLTLTGLAPHSSIGIGFYLAVIDSWDGQNTGINSGDFFRVYVDGNLVFDESFATAQTRVGGYAGLSMSGLPNQFHPGRTDKGWGSTPLTDFADDGWDLSLASALQNIPHSSSTLTIDWIAGGPGWQGGVDESWGMEKLVITADGGPVIPLPSAAGLGLAGLGALGLRRRRIGRL